MDCIDSGARNVTAFARCASYRSDGFRFYPGDVLYGRLRPYLNKVWTADREGVCSGEFIVLPESNRIDGRYLGHALRDSEFVSFATDLNRGDRPRVTFEQIADYAIPVPPLEEQHRIADKLDHIAARLDDTKTRLDTISTILKRFRMSVLAAACSGRLTEDWRRSHQPEDEAAQVIESIKHRNLRSARTLKERAAIQQRSAYVEDGDNEDLHDTWRFVALDKLATFNYGTSAKSQKAGRMPVLRMGNVQGGEIDWQDLVFTSDQVEINKYALKPLTVLFNRTNSPELVGKTAIYRGERPAIFAGYLIRINAEEELLPDYLNYCLNSPNAKAWCGRVKTDGVSQSNINAQKLGKYEIPYCCPEEQAEIVRRVTTMFKQADSIEARYRKAHAFTDKLMPAALAKAFRGELVQSNKVRDAIGVERACSTLAPTSVPIKY
jgi:type I restriction enzyme S subunit